MSAKTIDKKYTEILQKSSNAFWKKVLDVQRPYRHNIKKLNLGKTLDVGCGIGRNLVNLSSDSVGVDHNKHSLDIVNKLGLNACMPGEFIKNKKYKKSSFDSLLIAHVLEHLNIEESKQLIKNYLPYISKQVVIICPQEKGYSSDNTHVTFLDSADLELILIDLGLKIRKSYSFPFYRSVGKIFKYNETVVVATKP